MSAGSTRSARRRSASKADVPADRDAYLRRYYAQADADELASEPGTLAAAALAHLEWARMREPDTALVRVFNATMERDGWTSKHTIIETANDDMPFLVDSLEMALTRIGHPILRHDSSAAARRALATAARSPPSRRGDGKIESFIHFEVVRETDAALLSAIEAALAATLRDVRAAVEDWPKMLERLRHGAAELRATPGLPDDLKAESSAFLEWLARDHFTLLGYREYELADGDAYDTLAPRTDTGLGVLRGRARATRSCGSRATHATEARSPDAARDHEVERALDGPSARDARSRRHQGVRRERQAVASSGRFSACSLRAPTTRARARSRCCG